MDGGEGNVVPVNHAMNMNKGHAGKAPHTLDLGTRWRLVASFTFHLLHYLLDRRLHEAHSWSVHRSEETSLSLPGINPLSSSLQSHYSLPTVAQWNIYVKFLSLRFSLLYCSTSMLPVPLSLS